jgi:hypothetical protein
MFAYWQANQWMPENTFFKLRTLTPNIDLLVSRPKIKIPIFLQDNKDSRFT